MAEDRVTLSGQGTRALAAALLVGFALTACGQSATEPTSAPPPAAQVQPVNLPALTKDLQPRALVLADLTDAQVPVEQWPDACDVLQPDDLSALFATEAKVEQEKEKGKFFDGATAPKNTRCAYRVIFGTGSEAQTALVELNLRAFADARLLRADHDQRNLEASAPGRRVLGHYKNYDSSFGAECFFGGFALECVSGGMQYQVGGAPPTRAGDTADEPTQTAWREEVLAKFVKHIDEGVRQGDSANADNSDAESTSSP